MAMFHTEFGLGYSFASYRGKGSLPASGAMFFSQLYGASNIIREPASGEIYQTSAPTYYWQVITNGGGDGKGRHDIYWAGTLVYGNGVPYQTTTLAAGGKTYYRGAQQYQSGTTIKYSFYRTTP
jgi:hypothetical protein